MTPALESKKGFDPRDADAGASQEHKSVDQTIREARDTVGRAPSRRGKQRIPLPTSPDAQPIRAGRR